MDSKTLDRCFLSGINNYKLELDARLEKFTKEKQYYLKYISSFHKIFLNTIAEENKYEDDFEWGNNDCDHKAFQYTDQLISMLEDLYPNSEFQFHKVPGYDFTSYYLRYKLNSLDVNQSEVIKISEELKERKRQLVIDKINKKQKELEILKSLL